MYIFYNFYHNDFMKDSLWYYALNKSPLTPPAWVFPIAWTILYLMVAISLLFYVKGGLSKDKAIPLLVFSLQIVLNILWSPVFFDSHDINLAFVIILMLIVFVFANIILFYKKSKLSAYLLIPYFLWLIFAGYLNFEIIRLN